MDWKRRSYGGLRGCENGAAATWLKMNAKKHVCGKQNMWQNEKIRVERSDGGAELEARKRDVSYILGMVIMENFDFSI